MPLELVLARHGETEWSRDGRHTGRTDIPLTEKGAARPRRLRDKLAEWSFVRVLSSPLSRALETCRLAGLGESVATTDDLLEWDYGEYEGITTAEIRESRPDWILWRDGCPGGETAADVGARVDRVIAEVGGLDGPVALFAHGHVLRVLTARWLGLELRTAPLFALGTGTLSVLGYERETRVDQALERPLRPRRKRPIAAAGHHQQHGHADPAAALRLGRIAPCSRWRSPAS